MRALASDYDGTLYFDGVFKQDDVKAIHQFQKDGHLFGLCTGRPLVGVIDKHHINYDFYILSSGAVIYDKDLTILYESVIPRKVVTSIVNQYLNDYEIFIQANRDLYVLKEAENIIPLTFISSLDDIAHDHFYSISINGKSEEHASKLCKILNRKFPDIVAFQNIKYIDIVSKDCSKGDGIKRLRQLLQLDEISGIGDSYNDIPMLEEVDISFTFHHSPDIVKQNASYLVSSIAESIEILSKKG